MSICWNKARAIILDIQEDTGVVKKYGVDKVIFTKADVTKEYEIKAAIDMAIDHFGKKNS